MDKAKKYTTIVWDLDGTLMDSLQDLHDAVNYGLTACNMPLRTMAETKQSVGNGVRRLMVLSVPDGETNPRFEEAFAAFKTYYVAHCEDHTRPYAGIEETLHRLKDAGYRMALVSNKLQAGVDELYRTWFADTFAIAVGDSPALKRKPEPDMVYEALARMGVERESAVYVGDSEVDVMTARNAGLPCISVLWGYREKAFLLTQGAKHFAVTPDEIPALLVRMETEGE